jgi:ADP-heptose:LPS heptosyltransferase
VPDINCGNPSINLTSEEEKSFQTIISKLPNDFSRPWIACGIASNRSISIWPLERYQKVLTVLIEKYSIWPVILGGVDDFDLGQDLIKRLNCGYNFAGKVSVRLSAIALQRCWLYCGNDTGTMHLAASVGISCIAIFSSAQYPGLWYPYGQGHHIYRTPIECEGCELDDCILKQKQCILSISVAEVLSGCEKILNNLNITSSISKS